jgi:hypothetical protein
MTPSLVIENVLPALAHEIRQPLGAIEAIAYYMTLLHSGDDQQREQLARIQRLVEQANWILSASVALSDTRTAAPTPVDLEELILQTVSARASASDPQLDFAFTPDLPLVYLDPGFGRILVETLLCLFRQLATDANPAMLRTKAVPAGVELEMATAAPGYRNLAMLPPGSAIALDCVRRIAAMHGGTLDCQVDPLSGIRARVMLP